VKAYILLFLAIVAEVIATSSLKSIKGFSTPIPLFVTILGYIVSFWLLAIVLRSIPIGIAYAIWSSFGIVLVSVAAFVLYKQSLDFPAIVGIGLILLGVLIINIFSKTDLQ